jgi:hypothetical protein
MGKLQQLIQKLKTKPMSVGALKKVLPPHTTFKLLSQLTGHRSTLFKRHRCIAVLVPSDFSKIGHYVLLTAFPRYIEYYSSLGGSPEQETKKLGQDGDKLMNLLGRNYVYNSKTLQASDTTIADCALHVLCRAQLHELKLREYQALFSSRVSLQSPDDVVALMTILLVVSL